MGIKKKSSKGGNYAGGVLHPYDWNAKSQKKLLSRKTDLPEKPKQKKRIEGRSLFRMLDDYGIEARSRGMKESSYCSCASSITEDSFYKSYFQDFTELEDHKVVERPMKEFKTKILAPESAKSVATVIDPSEKTNLPMSSSSSSTPLKIREVKRQSRSDCNVVKNLRERHSKSKISRNGSEDNGVKSKGKSISLALQAKANVQKREALNSNSMNEKNEKHALPTAGINPCSPIQFHDTFRLYSTNACLLIEGYTDLSDTASSASAKTVARSWELDYVKELLNDVEPMFMDYALGKTEDFIKPRVFKKLENQKGHPKNVCEMTSRMSRRLMFDCVNECLDLRFRQYAFAGYELWDEGLRRVKRKEALADEVFKEISGWGAMGHFMVDEIVESYMTGKNRRWIDYEVELFEVGMKIESRVLSVLIDEVVDDVFVL